MSDESTKNLEQHTKRLFDDSVTALDGATRSRLTQARFRALEELAPVRARSARWLLVPAGALAAGAAVVWLTVGPGPSANNSELTAATLSDLEILLSEEDLEMLDEELEFYGWLEEQPEFEPDDSVG